MELQGFTRWGLTAMCMAWTAACGGGAADDADDLPIDAGDDLDGGPPADAAGDPCLEPGVTCYYLAPDGDDGNAGTIDAPWFNLGRAWGELQPGDVLYLRGGNYELATKPVLTGTSGTAEAKIRVWNYPGEVPVLQPGPDYVLEEFVGVFFIGDHVHFRGIEFTGFVNVDAFVARAMRVEGSSHNIFERLHMHHNGAGLLIQDLDGGGAYSTDNLVLNSDFHDNADPFTGYGNADGLGINFIYGPGASNRIIGCRAWNNSDDGIDVFANDGHVLIEDSWSWHNGFIPGTDDVGGNGDGFKLGITTYQDDAEFRRTIRRSLAVANRLTGFHQEEADARMELVNNTAYANGEQGFNLYNIHDRAHLLRNNVAYANGTNQAEVSPSTVADHNAAGGGGGLGGWDDLVSDEDFVSLDISQLAAPRGPGGALPPLTLLHLTAGSDLVDAGVDVGQPFTGAAPDLGAFER
jgi:hypothetical protein